MSKRILVVDDEASIRRTVGLRLEKEGYEVEVACNGEEAVGLYVLNYDSNPYSLILLDIMMPGAGGLEVLKQIRSEEELRSVEYGEGIPIIMLTALKETWYQSFNMGCDDYIVKPFDSTVLLNKIKEKIG